MAKIELVIKMNEEDYEIMKHNVAVDNPLCSLGEKEMVTIVANGLPLPKGHGRLISVDSLIKAIEEKAKRLSNADIINGLCGAVALIFDEQTILEADKESEDKE